MTAIGRLPIRLRLTIVYTAVVTLTVALFAGATHALVRSMLLRTLDRDLERRLALVADTLLEEAGELGELEDHGAVPLFRIADAEGTLYATAAWDRAHLPPPAPSGPSWVPARAGAVYRVAVRTVRYRGRETAVAVAEDASRALATLGALRTAFLVGIPGVLALAAGAGVVLARRALEPVGEMAATARRITAEHLSERLPVANPEDELGRLARVLNDLLERLESSFTQLRRFTADAAHELRTPLAAIRSVGEVGLETASSLDECRDVVGSLLEEVDRLSRLVDSLLLLARADAGAVPLAPQPTDLARLVEEVVELMRPLAEERSQELALEAAARPRVRADHATLRQALMDVLDNAIRYTPEGGAIGVRVATLDRRWAAVAVRDSGPGIPESARERIFDRFFRAGPSRSHDHRGLGLGLAVARWAVEANRGRIEVASQPGRGSTFTIVLPLDDDAARAADGNTGGPA